MPSSQDSCATAIKSNALWRPRLNAPSEVSIKECSSDERVTKYLVTCPRQQREDAITAAFTQGIPGEEVCCQGLIHTELCDGHRNKKLCLLLCSYPPNCLRYQAALSALPDMRKGISRPSLLSDLSTQIWRWESQEDTMPNKLLL